MSAVDLILSRVDARPNGPNRWRCACPVCGASNRSTLSIGVGDNGCVLLKCWKDGCSPEEIASVVGLSIDDLFPPRDSSGASPAAKRRLISWRQALDLLHDEAVFIAVAGSNIARGAPPTGDDLSRVRQAAGRVAYLRDEVMS